VTLTIYTRPGCHLCDVMKDTVRPIAAQAGLTLDEVDISADAALEARYGLDIPVLVVDGKKIAKYRVSAEEVRRAIAARA